MSFTVVGPYGQLTTVVAVLFFRKFPESKSPIGTPQSSVWVWSRDPNPEPLNPKPPNSKPSINIPALQTDSLKASCCCDLTSLVTFCHMGFQAAQVRRCLKLPYTPDPKPKPLTPKPKTATLRIPRCQQQVVQGASEALVSSADKQPL